MPSSRSYHEIIQMRGPSCSSGSALMLAVFRQRIGPRPSFRQVEVPELAGRRSLRTLALLPRPYESATQDLGSTPASNTQSDKDARGCRRIGAHLAKKLRLRPWRLHLARRKTAMRGLAGSRYSSCGVEVCGDGWSGILSTRY
jgi:hypothetical protein